MILNLKQLEARLQALIEVHLVSALPGYNVETLVIQKLVSAMNDNLIEKGNLKIAPNVYTIIAHPTMAAKLQDSRLLEVIIESLIIVGSEVGLEFETSPTLSINTKNDLSVDTITVLASHQVGPAPDTVGMTPVQNAPADENSETMPDNAFLIINGIKLFPLKMNVINIGRRLDNQLVIDDPRISRSHAQLRAIKGRFVIFDLNSTGGTYVNGQRTSQTVLYPGDVISLAGIPLVFGQDNPPRQHDIEVTSPVNSASSDRPTAYPRKTGKLNSQKENQ